MRKKFVWRDGQIVEVPTEYRSPVAPYIHQDTMDAAEHPATCKMVDSKSTWRRMTRESGYEDRTGMKRVADNAPKWKECETEHYERDVKIAYEQLKSGTAPLTEYDREVCKRINEQLRNR